MAMLESLSVYVKKHPWSWGLFYEATVVPSTRASATREDDTRESERRTHTRSMKTRRKQKFEIPIIEKVSHHRFSVTI